MTKDLLFFIGAHCVLLIVMVVAHAHSLLRHRRHRLEFERKQRVGVMYRAFNQCERALVKRLLGVAERLQIPVKIVDSMSEVGHYLFQTDRKTMESKPLHISLRRDCIGEGKGAHIVLAHELGHHIAIQRRGDLSERGADEEGIRLMRSLLSDDELRTYECVLDALLKHAQKEKD